MGRLEAASAALLLLKVALLCKIQGNTHPLKYQ